MGLLDSFFKKKNSGASAKKRLQFVLVSDRTNCSPEIMEQLKNDIIAVISKYMEIDMENLDIQLTGSQSEDGGPGAPTLCANIPIKEVKIHQ